MSSRSFFHRSQPHRKVRRATRGHAGRGPRFETFEDRRLLSLTPVPNVTVGSDPEAVVAADFNNDGHLDLATANAGSDNVSVLLGSANGTFGGAIDSPAGDSPKSIAVGDFDDDGNLDLAAVNGRYGLNYGEGYVNVMFGNGNGSFQPPSRIGINPELNLNYYSAAHSVAVGDFNGDGTMDLAAAGWGYDVYGHASVLLSNGNRTFAEPKIAVHLLSIPVRSMAVADFNDDGDQDLVVATSSGPSEVVQVLLGDGEGNFANVSNSNWLIDHGTSMAVGDLDGDGDTDLVTADGNDVNVRLGNGVGGFEPPPGGHSYIAGDGPSSVVLGDFNRDGVLDVATANLGSNDVSILRGLGDGTFSNPENFAAGPGAIAIEVGDFNGDGWLDLATANVSENSVSVLINNGIWGAVPPIVSVNNATVTEGNAGTLNAAFTVSLSAAYVQAVTVNYATANGTATAGSDYQSKTGTVTFAPGETSKTITVSVMGDRQKESNETFFVNLSGAIGGGITDSQGLGTILNDDGGGSKGRSNSSAWAFDAAIEDWMFFGRKKRAR